MTSSPGSDMLEALRAKPAALSTFEGLPPSHKAEYLKWTTSAVGRSGRFRTVRTEHRKTEAKRDDTRKRRIAGMIEKLTVGTGVPKAVGRTDDLSSGRTERGAE